MRPGSKAGSLVATPDAPPVRLSALTLRLFHHIDRRRRLQFAFLLALTLVGSVAEVVSLGAVVPFIGILTQPERVFASKLVGHLVGALGITTPQQLVLPLTILFIGAAIITGAIRLLLLWVSTRLTNATGADLSVAVYRRTLYQPYSVHVARSSSEIISGMTQKVATATAVLMSMVTVLTSSLLFLGILGTLFVIDPLIALLAAVGFGSAYVTIAWTTRRRLRRNSEIIAHNQTTVVKALQEGLGAIRDVLLDGTQTVYSNVYAKGIRRLLRATGDNSYITLAPRFAMETIGLVLVGTLAYVLGREGDVGSALPRLAALGLGAQRLLPLLQLMYGNWSAVAGNQAALIDVLDLLDQPVPDDADAPPPPALAFRRQITFDHVRFRYDADGPWVIDGIDIVIPKGARIGIIGTTGSGKSTALDLLMSLLEPTQGRILVDGEQVTKESRRAWQRTLAHVPQSIYLSDATISENIAFGVPKSEIDQSRVREAAQQAQLAEFIEGRPEGYNAIVGERGVRLSGGQRQRIGIARALYKQATVLIFDEATSALDGATEQSVMSAISQLGRDLTLVIIAHRLQTLDNCDTIVRLENGRVAETGSYEHFMHYA